MDIDGISGGKEYPLVLHQSLANARVVVAVIGETWLASADDQGRRRLDNDQDFVRQELQEAFRQGKTVIPVLLDNAKWPDAIELPEDLRPIATRNYIAIRHETFGKDLATLVAAIRLALSPSPEYLRARNKRIAQAAALLIGVIAAFVYRDFWMSELRNAGLAMKQMYADWQQAGPGAQRIEDRTAWEAAQRQDVISAYETYVALQPNGTMVTEARSRIAKLRADAERARQKRDRDEAEQRRREEQIRRKLADDQRRLEQQREDDSAYEAANRINEPAALKVYIERFPTGRHLEAARQSLASLENSKRRDEDLRAWTSAETLNTRIAYEGYLSAWPKGENSERARTQLARLIELERHWTQLRGSNSAGQLRQFMKDASGTSFALQAQARLAQVEAADTAAWSHAEEVKTRAAYLRYLGNWREGDYLSEVKSRLEEIDQAEAEWRRIKGKHDESALIAFLERPYIADFESAALAELVVLKREMTRPLPDGIIVLTAEQLGRQINGKKIHLNPSKTGVVFTSGSQATPNIKIRPNYLAVTTKQKFSTEGSFSAEIQFEGRRLAIEGIAGIQESNVDKTGSLLLLQILATDRNERDLATKDRLYATMQIVRKGDRYVCFGTQWTFVLGDKPKPFDEQCVIE